jgi:hypothetical protein
MQEAGQDRIPESGFPGSAAKGAVLPRAIARKQWPSRIDKNRQKRTHFAAAVPDSTEH